MSADGPARRRQIEDATAARLAEIVASAERAAKQVIDDAEAEARERLAGANEEADRIVAARLERLADLIDDFDAQAEALKHGAGQLREALAEARAELAGTGSSAEAPIAPATERAANGPRAGEDDRATAPDADAPPPTSAGDRDADRPAAPSLTVVSADPPPIPEPPARPEPDPRATRPETVEPAAAANGFASVGEPETTPAGARLLATQMAVSGSSRDEIERRLRSGFAITDTTAILDAILGPER